MEAKNYLAEFQSKLKAPKGQYNNFGKYKYRSAEDIVEAVKPIINPEGFSLILSDEIIQVGERIYVKAIVTLSNGTINYQTTAFAREEEEKKGMDSSQITGAASSYARKYALNGLFAIDDTADSDATNDHYDKKQSHDNQVQNKETDEKPWLDDKTIKKILGTMRLEKPIMIGSVTFNNNNEIVDYVTKKYRMKKVYKEQLMDELNCELNKAFNNE